MADPRTRRPSRIATSGKRRQRPDATRSPGFEIDKPIAEHAAETTLTALSIPTDWPADVRTAVAGLPQGVNGGHFPGRTDLRGLPLVTIDGESARDFDDAVFAASNGEGWRLVVAIADVAHYVKAGSPLDTVAWDRGTSVYLPDRVVPMLPEALSNDLCSLRPREARLALVCDMEVDKSGRVAGYRFYEAVIRSWQRMTYTRIAAYLSGEKLPVETPVVRSLDALAEAYRALLQARDRRGALDFDTPESTLSLENGRVKAITPVVRNDAHRLIEEAMIAANVCAARFLERHKMHALYRVHEAPEQEKAEQLGQAFAARGVRWSPEDRTPTALRGALLAVAGHRDRWLFEMLVLRAMQQANYRPERKGHFGLALTRYMHFTSPIRRYPDLVAHRAIKRVLHRRGGQIAPSDWLAATGEQSSVTERRAEDASRRVDAWLKCEFLAERIGETFSSVVAGVTDFGLFVDLKGFYIQGLLHISELGADYYQHHPGSMSLVGERSGARFTLGDELKVRLTSARPELGRLDLVLADAASRRRRGRRR